MYQCLDDRRRELVHQNENKGGIDYIEIIYQEEESNRIPALCVHFFGKMPVLDTTNVRIKGGRRVKDISVLRIEERQDQNSMLLILDRQGDFSTYTLEIVESGDSSIPFSDLDQRYAKHDFSFKAGCSSDLDCKPLKVCPPQAPDEPEISYLAKDYASFRQLMLDRISLNMPEWKERHIPDLGIALVELLAYIGDHLSYYQDAVATEAYLDTARLRTSVRRHVRLIDYRMHEGCNSRAWVCVKTDNDIGFNLQDIYFITRPSGYPSGIIWREEDLKGLGGGFEVFEPMSQSQGLLSQWDLKDPGGLATSLNKEEYPVSIYLKKLLSEGTIRLLKGFSALAKIDPKLITSLIRDLNYLIQGESIYDATHFKDLQLRPETKELIGQKPTGRDLIRLNRLLIEDAYPDFIRKCDEVVLQEAQSCINFYTWEEKECCLPKGSTRATLRCKAGHRHNNGSQVSNIPSHISLKAGDVLIFEEVRGPRTGYPGDADRTHRHPVRLTKVTYGEDDLPDPPVPVIEIEWAKEDALPFPLCISAIGSEPQCALIEDISVARGNVILVDNGRTEYKEALGEVMARDTKLQCEGEGRLSEVQYLPERFRRRLKKGPITFSQPLSDLGIDAPASKLMKQDPRLAIANIELLGTRLLPYQDTRRWEARRDLLESRNMDRHFALEVDDRDQPDLFLGDGELGRMAEVGTEFLANYRVGNGPSGNVGAEMINSLVFRKGLLSGVALEPRNPLPAQGGRAPEPLSEVRLFAPFSFRSELQRAVTAEDYAELAKQHPRVQNADGILRWTGSWNEVKVMVDPRGLQESGEKKELLSEIEKRLYRYRRMGHDLAVVEADYVPLDIEMMICVKLEYLRGHVKAALLDAFSNRLRPNGKPGFFHPDNLSFGDGISLSRLVAVAQGVTGVESVEVTRLQRYGELPNQEIEKGILSLSPHEVARLDNDPDFPENGRINLDMRGGR